MRKDYASHMATNDSKDTEISIQRIGRWPTCWDLKQQFAL